MGSGGRGNRINFEDVKNKRFGAKGMAREKVNRTTALARRVQQLLFTTPGDKNNPQNGLADFRRHGLNTRLSGSFSRSVFLACIEIA